MGERFALESFGFVFVECREYAATPKDARESVCISVPVREVGRFVMLVVLK